MKKYFSFFSVLGGVAELGIAAGYTVFSILFLIFGYKDYLINRRWIVPLGCFCVIASFHFLTGMAIRNVSRYFERCPVLFGEVGCSIGIAGIMVWEMLAWLIDIFQVKGAEGFMAFAVFLLLLHQRICLCYLFKNYGKSGAMFYLLMYAASALVLVTDEVTDEVLRSYRGNWMMIWRVVPIWLIGTFLLGLLGHLLSAAFRKKKGEFWEGQNRHRRVCMGVLSGGIVCFLFMVVSRETADNMLSPSPRRDEDGYYLLCSREGFEWFIDRTGSGDEERDINVRLAADIVLNDTSGWEHWEEEPPGNAYDCIARYRGHFDGDGHALEGYYSAQELPVFGTLEEHALVTDLKIQRSLFQATYEKNLRMDGDEGVFVLPASALCYRNEGRIEGCDVEAIVLGDWEAGGIACINEGMMKDCRFAGTVESGRWFEEGGEDRWFEEGEGKDRWATEDMYTGGICGVSIGSIQDCQNEGTISTEVITDTHYMHYDCGGIAGVVGVSGSVTGCANTGRVSGVQSCGGIAGESLGEIRECSNEGEIHVEPQHVYVAPVITAGICASNRGLVDSCFSTGELSVGWSTLSAIESVYGIACNLGSGERGRTKNCYYLPESAEQVYRQKGVYKLSKTQMAEVGKYIEAGQAAEKGSDSISDAYVISDVDSLELFPALPDLPGTDRDDYIRLQMGPKQDTVYEVSPGDTLWGIAEKFYEDGMYYPELVREEEAEGGFLHPGEEILVPHLDRYLLCANEEEGFNSGFYMDAFGEMCPIRYYMAKPVDWYYGEMDFAAGKGLEVLWPKDKERGQGAAAGDIRIFCYLDGNSDGDFFAGDWEGAKEKIRESAGLYCGGGIEGLRFYRYGLDGDEFLYGYSFRLYPGRCPFESTLRSGVGGQDPVRIPEALNCAVFYRVREGLVAEFIGIEPASEDMHVLERTRYLAARVADGPELFGRKYSPTEFYGWEGWAFGRLHNPFAVALEYSPDAECAPLRMAKGPQ